MPVRSQFLMIEHARCSNFHFRACSSPLDARFFHTRCNTAFENRQILAKIVHFWSNARAKARSCRIFQCSSMLEPEFGFSSMLEPARCSNIYFRACSSPLDARLFHTRCNTSYIHLSHVFFYESYAFHNIDHSEVKFKFILFWRPSCTFKSFEVIVLYGSSLHLKKKPNG